MRPPPAAGVSSRSCLDLEGCPVKYDPLIEEHVAHRNFNLCPHCIHHGEPGLLCRLCESMPMISRSDGKTFHVLLADRPLAYPQERQSDAPEWRFGLLLVLSHCHRRHHSCPGRHLAPSAFGPASPFPDDRFRCRSPRRRTPSHPSLGQPLPVLRQRPPITRPLIFRPPARAQFDSLAVIATLIAPAKFTTEDCLCRYRYTRFAAPCCLARLALDSTARCAMDTPASSWTKADCAFFHMGWTPHQDLRSHPGPFPRQTFICVGPSIASITSKSVISSPDTLRENPPRVPRCEDTIPA